MASIFNNIIKSVNEIYPKIVDHRRIIHRNPELAFEEFRTSEYIQTCLDCLGIPYKVIAGTGIVGIIGKGEKCVALRADIDALPITEENDFEYISQNEGKMHACGHDMHIAMLLGAAEILKYYQEELEGTVKIIFQPGEEKVPGGALKMIEEGVLSEPIPAAIFGQHADPQPEVGKFSFASGPIMASADELYWTIKGNSSHAAQPHLGSDTVLTASNLVVHLQSLITKFRDPLKPGVLSITSIHGGTATNIFPNEIKLMGTLRSFDAEWREEMHKLIEEHSKLVSALYNTECRFKIKKGYPTLFNNEITTKIAQDTAAKLFGDNACLAFQPKMWAEDFAYYAEKIPATFWFLGVRNPKLESMENLHNSRFAPEEEAMIYGTSMLASVAINFLNTKEHETDRILKEQNKCY
jgi:amidohydrolase